MFLRKWIRRFLKFILAIFVILFLFSIAGRFFSEPINFARNAIGVLEITGGIYEAQEWLDQIRKLKQAEGVKGVIVRIDSPGGAVGASQELYEALQDLADVKPLFASLGSVAASGGYYAACGAKKIIANPGTVTGSIGVRVEHADLSELLDWAKLRLETIKSGKYKDILSVNRPITPEERQLVHSLLGDLHLQFKEAVAESRQLTMTQVNAFADGRVFSGRHAMELGLVDRLGGFNTAVNEMKNELKLAKDPNLIFTNPKEGWWVELMQSAFDSGIPVWNELNVLYKM